MLDFVDTILFQSTDERSLTNPANTWTTVYEILNTLIWNKTRLFHVSTFLVFDWVLEYLIHSWCGSNPRCWFVSDKSSSKFCRSTLLICVWQIKFFNTKQFQYCWIAFSLKEIGKLMCYKTLNDKNTHLIAWNEILTQFGECDSLPNPVCTVVEPGAHAEN